MQKAELATTPSLERSESPKNTETVLAAEDDSAQRTLTMRILTHNWCTVLTARDGVEDLASSEERAEPIDLLQTDVMMPQVGGVEWATEIAVDRNGIRVIFMSGYTDETIGGNLIEKCVRVFCESPSRPINFLRPRAVS